MWTCCASASGTWWWNGKKAVVNLKANLNPKKIMITGSSYGLLNWESEQKDGHFGDWTLLCKALALCVVTNFTISSTTQKKKDTITQLLARDLIGYNPRPTHLVILFESTTRITYTPPSLAPTSPPERPLRPSASSFSMTPMTRTLPSRKLYVLFLRLLTLLYRLLGSQSVGEA